MVGWRMGSRKGRAGRCWRLYPPCGGDFRRRAGWKGCGKRGGEAQDKESASQYRATTGLPCYFRSFFVRHGDAHASEWRAPHASQCVTVTTAPRGARRKPFGPSEKCTRRMAAALVLGLIALAGPVALGRLFRVRITLTDSAAPGGIYRVVTGVPVVRGALVAACLPAAIARTGLTRGYLREGDCPAGAEPVAKVISGLPGDVVEVEPSWVAVDG